jgi:hypothetical protein
MYAQDIPLFSGIQFNQTVEAVQTSVASRAGHIALKEVDRPVFPMAEKSEAHLVALQYETGSHTLEEVVLTFADDQLVLIQAKGNVMDAFLGKWKPDLGGGPLNMVWILTAKGEEERLRAKLVHQYGGPVYEDEDWVIFHDWQVCLRMDKPEILLVTPELGKLYKRDYFGQD